MKKGTVTCLQCSISQKVTVPLSLSQLHAVSSQKNTRNPAGLCADDQARPLMKNGFVHASLSIVRGETTETADVPCAG